MKRKIWPFQLLYYALSCAAYVGFYYFFLWMFRLFGGQGNLGAAIIAVYVFLFMAIPILTVLLARLSLLKWYVDPIAAAIFPLMLYAAPLFGKMVRYHHSFAEAFQRNNQSLSADGGEGWFILLGLYLFGLLSSLSFTRKDEQSISYKLLSKITR